MNRRFFLLAMAAGMVLHAPAADTKPAPRKEPFQNIDVRQFERMRSQKDTVILDVRTQKEFAAGHVPGAILIDVNASDFDQKVAKLDKNKTYLVHCAAGVRSAKACHRLAPLQFEKLFNLEGGFRAWEKAGNTPEK